MKKAKLGILLLTFIAGISGCTKERLITEEGNLVPKTVEQDPGISSISVNGTRLHAETFGDQDSAMLVVLHGGPGSDYRSLLNAKQFAAQGFHVVFYDQRGSGLSKRHNKSTYTTNLMLHDLEAVIAHFRRSPSQKVFLLGHSWGAILATAYINEYPTAINGVILAEPGGFTWVDIEGYVTRSRSVKITSELLNDFLFSEQFITGDRDEHAILDYKYALLASADGDKDNPVGNEARVPFWRSGAVVNQALFEIGDKEKPNWTTNLNLYSTKVLFVYSERNRAYGFAYAQKVSSAYPNVQLLKINNAGHEMLYSPAGWNHFYPVALQYLNSLK